MSYKYFVYFNFFGGSGFVESGTDRTIVNQTQPISSIDDLTAIEELIAASLQYDRVQIVNLSQITD